MFSSFRTPSLTAYWLWRSNPSPHVVLFYLPHLGPLFDSFTHSTNSFHPSVCQTSLTPGNPVVSSIDKIPQLAEGTFHHDNVESWNHLISIYHILLEKKKFIQDYAEHLFFVSNPDAWVLLEKTHFRAVWSEVTIWLNKIKENNLSSRTVIGYNSNHPWCPESPKRVLWWYNDGGLYSFQWELCNRCPVGKVPCCYALPCLPHLAPCPAPRRR